MRTELFSRAGHTAFVQIYYELALASYVDRFPKATAPVGQSYFPKNLLRFSRACVRTIPSLVLFGTDGGGQLVACTGKDRVRGRA